MLNETNGLPILRQWKKFVKEYCPRCYQRSRHLYVHDLRSRAGSRGNYKGMVHTALYKCQTEDCSQLVELEVFIKTEMQTLDMFRDQLNDD